MVEIQKEMIRCRVILEVLGKPKEHVEKTVKLLVDSIRENPSISILKEDYAKAIKKGKTLFSTFVELEMVVKDTLTLIGFCFDYMPSSLEIERPEELTIKNNQLSSLLNDLQAKLHNVDMVAKTLRAERDVLKKSLNLMMKNIVTILIKIGRNTLDSLSKYSGIDIAGLENFLNSEIKAGNIKKEGDVYSLVKKGDDIAKNTIIEQ